MATPISSPDSTCLIIGCGIYGSTTALALVHRGYSVTVIDPGPVPHPLAASTDISKVVRMEYGGDRQYMAMVDAAIDGWQSWNDELGTLYHQTGVTMLTRAPLTPGEFEYESYHLLETRGHAPERLDAGSIAKRFPAWNSDNYIDGFFNPRAGFVESGRAVEALVLAGRRAGVTYEFGFTASGWTLASGNIVAVHTREGRDFRGDRVITCTGTWTPRLLGELSPVMKSSGHPVFHLRPSRPELFTAPNFVVFTADISHSGWYGFPLHPREGVVKIANHGVGIQLHPDDDERIVSAHDEAELRAFLVDTFPSLAGDPIVFTRRCLYNDTLDEHLWIDRHPEIANLTVAGGGSGHALKFAPILGDLIADAVEGRAHEWLAKFRWRSLDPSTPGVEEARYHGDPR